MHYHGWSQIVDPKVIISTIAGTGNGLFGLLLRLLFGECATGLLLIKVVEQRGGAFNQMAGFGLLGIHQVILIVLHEQCEWDQQKQCNRTTQQVEAGADTDLTQTGKIHEHHSL